MAWVESRSQGGLEYCGLSSPENSEQPGAWRCPGIFVCLKWSSCIPVVQPSLLLVPLTPRIWPSIDKNYMVTLPIGFITENILIQRFFQAYFQGHKAQNSGRSACVHEEKAALAYKQ